MDYVKDIREISDEQAVILWQASRLSLSGKYEKAPEILSVKGSVIGTLGNFSASIGKAKSKKTFNVSAIVAAALKNGTVLRYAAELPEAKRKVLYVDTEQSPHHCLNVMERIMRMAGLPDDRDNENLEFLALRKYTPEQRIRIVEQAIYHTPNLGLVIIDGIRDMVYDINSPSESTRIISKLMQWTDDRQIHIHTILHQNKGDENARGHIGTELNNKAETVLLVEKDKSNGDISKVSAMHIRAMDFEPFAFRINDKALPELMEDYQTETKAPGRPQGERFDACKDISEQQHRIALEAAFSLQDEYGYKELGKALKESYALVGVPLSDNKLVKLITVLKNKRMIVQENGRKYRYEPNFHY
ncbi:AAA family ATPase [Bacteroides uniformis]|uniref:AAA family ATPase n=1 Tax=Bacteroides uniformis TaxID=820 RepID=UPI001584F119|nr:AAA family ATPase [Bacteroides uniformis]NUN88554.1 AAA family ATPase [Bacteroides uniformis]